MNPIDDIGCNTTNARGKGQQHSGPYAGLSVLPWPDRLPEFFVKRS